MEATAINPNSTVPLYRQLTDLLRNRIASGELGDGARLPSEAQFGDAFHVSRITVRQALAELEREGRVTRVPGKGTFAATTPRPLVALTRLSSFSEDAASAGLVPGYLVLAVGERPIDQETRTALAQPMSVAFTVERVLLADGRPVGMHCSALPDWLVARLDPAVLSAAAFATSSLYRTVERAGVEMHRAVETLQPARIAADAAPVLGLQTDDLVLQIGRTVYDSDDRPLVVEIDTYLPDAYTYRVELFRR